MLSKNFSFNNDPNETNIYWDEKYWTRAIDDLGPEKSYKLLKEKLKGRAYLPIHQALHSFGFALYKKFGHQGIKYCDDYQRFGCYHGVLASYISDKGLSALDDVETLCPKNQPSSENRCFHGIGHGLVDYLGKSSVNEALLNCKRLDL